MSIEKNNSNWFFPHDYGLERQKFLAPIICQYKFYLVNQLLNPIRKYLVTTMTIHTTI